MNIKKVHYWSGLLLATFVGVHLFNHFTSIFGEDVHLRVMDSLRGIYRNPVAETLLLAAAASQILSGLKLALRRRKTGDSFFTSLQIRTGLYLAIFLLIHLGAVLAGRAILKLDTNLYFGVAGLNTFPLNLFFIPYYGLAMLSFFGHIAAIHRQKMRSFVLGISPVQQSQLILFLGMVITMVIFYGLTSGFQGMDIPEPYQQMTGK